MKPALMLFTAAVAFAEDDAGYTTPLNGFSKLHNSLMQFADVTNLCGDQVENVALIGTPSGSGGGVGIYGPAGMNDLESEYFYWPSGDDYTPYIIYTWEQEQSFDRFVIFSEDFCADNGRGVLSGDVEYRDANDNWVPAGSVNFEANPIHFEFSQCIVTDALRVSSIATHPCSQDSNPIIREWSVCGCGTVGWAGNEEDVPLSDIPSTDLHANERLGFTFTTKNSALEVTTVAAWLGVGDACNEFLVDFWDLDDGVAISSSFELISSGDPEVLSVASLSSAVVIPNDGHRYAMMIRSDDGGSCPDALRHAYRNPQDLYNDAQQGFKWDPEDEVIDIQDSGRIVIVNGEPHFTAMGAPRNYYLLFRYFVEEE